MDWDRVRQEWRSERPAAPTVSVDELESRDDALQKQVRWRDLVETAAAIVVAVFFGFTVLDSAGSGEWVAFGSALLLVAWAVLVPIRLRRTRRWMPVVEHHMPLVEGLSRQRDAALAQARMLEQVWLWYLTPPTIGIFGLTLALRGPSTFVLVYLAAVLVLYAVLAWINRYAARTKFRAHAERLQRQIEALAGEDAP
ncbi:MAG: hypothetical protein ACTHZI_06170 [Luteimonas sp.]